MHIAVARASQSPTPNDITSATIHKIKSYFIFHISLARWSAVFRILSGNTPASNQREIVESIRVFISADLNFLVPDPLLKSK